ncbi:carboxypeptidase-like regulatory domain-containing protein [Mucilaginibacter sp. dw_454]|uniref:carboxypeptidase-like regulatory domain-containing protein n=1 Tax=Mucilaginibacter sp. dw_454 TaxID=2720079 RepID=UPI001BD565B5|nr:carboxypeptidase-like regulatory domain-containing protein [Mucilaginibacter sp. dw_454]
MKQLFFMLLMLMGFNASAQNKLIITGKVSGENQGQIIGATIFIAGTQLVTQTDADGKFAIIMPNAGAYHLLVKMLGYAVESEDVLLKDRDINLNIILKVKPIVLRQVTIGGDKERRYHLSVFKQEFLGRTKNARSCQILNPDVINFSTRKGIISAEADDFLIIENKNLGYRIKYLLKSFEHNIFRHTAYDGDAIFEELPGTDKQKLKWAHNRLETYKGSMMHFMRAVYNKTVLQEGFITHHLYNDSYGRDNDRDDDSFYYDPRIINFDTLTTVTDNSFIAFKFSRLYITYDPVKAAKLLKSGAPAITNFKPLYAGDDSSSSLIAYFKNGVVIDARGAINKGYVVSFHIKGPWTYKRVGDQLPFEYQPPKAP